MEASVLIKQCVEWERLPSDVIVEIARHVIETDGNLAAMRATCRHWQSAIASVPTALAPLGLPYHYISFRSITGINLAARGHSHATTHAELAAISSAAPRANTLNLSGAYQIASLGPLRGMQALTSLCLDGTAVTDTELESVLPHLQLLASLTLRECVFLKGGFLSTLQSLLGLHRLDISDCALSLHLHAATGRALAMLTSLQSLDIGGNNACDGTAASLAALPALRALSLRDGHALTEAGLEEFAAGPAGKSLEVLNLEGCSGLGDGCWAALARLQILDKLSLARVPNLLQSAPMPDHAAAALWRWNDISQLSLAGSNIHPSKLKILAATCGSALTELDFSCAVSGIEASSSRPPYARLTPQLVRDIIDAARSLKQLKVLKGARTGMPMEAAGAFLRAAPRLEVLDLSGCNLRPRMGLAQPATAGRLWSSGIFMPGAAPYRAQFEDVSSSLAAIEPRDFALALGGLAMLRTLRLEDCGLTPEHVRYLGWMKNLVEVSFAGNRGIGDAVIEGLVASGSPLRDLNLSGTSVTDGGLYALAANKSILTKLSSLKLGRCSASVSASGLKSLAEAAAGPVGSGHSRLRVLEISDCSGLDSGCVGTLVAFFPQLTSLNLSGCGGIGEEGVEMLGMLRVLRDLDLSRCGDAVTDDSLREVCVGAGQLTRLQLGGARKLSAVGASAALSMLPVLAEMDLTCCAGLGDDDAVKLQLPAGLLATVQLPQGGKYTAKNALRALRNGGPVAVSGPLPAL